MKRLFFILILTLMSYTYAIAGANLAVTDSIIAYEPQIETVNVGMPANVKVFPCDSLDVKIRTFDKELQNSIFYYIDDNILNIRIKDDIYIDDIYQLKSEDIRIIIGVPNDVAFKTNNPNLIIKYTSYKDNKNKKRTGNPSI